MIPAGAIESVRATLDEIVRRSAEICRRTGRDAVQIMEVCGTHTMSFAASGLRGMLPDTVRLLSGPGCPVCVTTPGDVDRAVWFARQPGVTLVTFGDMMKVPGSAGSLSDARALGADVRMAYSPADALELARGDPQREFIFLGVGFETTAPLVAATVRAAAREGIRNFSVFPLFKLVPPALRAILARRDHHIDGFILPGHVSAIIGLDPYRFVADEFGVPGIIAGFEPFDLLEALPMLLRLCRQEKAAIDIQYTRGVPAGGNPAALRILKEFFLPAEAVWRAVGAIPDSGLAFRPEYDAFNAVRKFPGMPAHDPPEPKGCLCGAILMGRILPADCPLFGAACTPETAVGPCMVSSEGACAAAYKYGLTETSRWKKSRRRQEVAVRS
ncbi:MAG: hydrogenase formation protein HypD [Candidatus Lindowbacteria bacterium RIFCSPLOWO2_12_FULL_62_27]|nr:MAG: hydrogenase formation protein HypD [Candidatus Lindowbacteria bacterium RIFCSPLOWO2_12_FULL_62_27]